MHYLLSIILALFIFVCGCSNKEVYAPDQLGTISESTSKDNDYPAASPEHATPTEGLYSDEDTSVEKLSEENNPINESLQETEAPSETVPPEQSSQVTPDNTTIIPIESPTSKIPRGNGVPETTRTMAAGNFDESITGLTHGVVKRAEEKDGLWYLDVDIFERSYATSETTGRIYIAPQATGTFARLCVGSGCNICTWFPYTDYTYSNAGHSIEDVVAVVGSVTDFNEPYYFEFNVRSGIIYEIELWTDYYDLISFEHGLAGIIYDDGSATGIDGGLTAAVAAQYRERDLTGIVTPGPKRTPIPSPSLLTPEETPSPN